MAAVIIRGVHERAIAKAATVGGGSRGYASLKWIVSKLGYPMVSPMELLEKIAPTPTQSGGDESRAATLALRLIVALEGIAACSLSELAGRINAEGRGSAATKRYNGRKAAPVVRRIARPLVIGRLGSLTMEEMVARRAAQ